MWHVYIVRCADGTLYTGVAKDLVNRINEHNRGRGAKYTRGRRPVELLYRRRKRDRGSALREEARVKKLSRGKKLALIDKQREW